VWIWDLQRGTLRRLTDDETDDYWPVWTLDGRRIVFNSFRGGGSAVNLHMRAADGSGVNERIAHFDSHQQAYSWEPDGETLLFQVSSHPETGFDIWRLPLGGSAPEQLIATGANEMHPALSPDGGWLAYTSDESGREEVYVTHYPELEGRQQVSSGGGMVPAWSREGGELFYRSIDGNRWFAVSFEGGPGEPQLLFEASDRRGFIPGPYGRSYDPTPDGSRFITLRPEWDVPDETGFRVVVGWGEELERTLETRR
jgi:Tol biopolymer transport system component